LFELSSLSKHFWPFPFPSENFGRHGKKVLRQTANPPSAKLPPARKATARRDSVTGETMSRIQSKTERELQAIRLRYLHLALLRLSAMILAPRQTDCIRLELVCGDRIVPFFSKAGVAELADALDSKSSGRKAVWVRAPPPAISFDVGRLLAKTFGVGRSMF
jgi:hypothetical protein